MATEDLPNLEMVYEIPTRLSAQLQLIRQTTEDVLRFQAGSIIELGQPASGSVNLCINNAPLARGEIVVVGKNLALKITEMATNSQ